MCIYVRLYIYIDNITKKNYLTHCSYKKFRSLILYWVNESKTNDCGNPKYL